LGELISKKKNLESIYFLIVFKTFYTNLFINSKNWFYFKFRFFFFLDKKILNRKNIKKNNDYYNKKGTNRAEPLFKQTYETAGKKKVFIRVFPLEKSLLVFTMINEHGQSFEDFVYISNNTKFYIWLKYMVISPVIVLCLPLIVKFMKFI
jgi:hypothetical protein